MMRLFWEFSSLLSPGASGILGGGSNFNKLFEEFFLLTSVYLLKCGGSLVEERKQMGVPMLNKF